MSKLANYPFGEAFDVKMGTSVFTEQDRLAEVDEHYHDEIALKRSLLSNNHSYYYKSSRDTEQAQWDVVEKILTDLHHFDPQNFILRQEGNNWYWKNNLLNEEISFEFGNKNSLPYEPLDWIGRQVQEDLVILSNDERVALIAGQLCFPNGWALEDKFGQPFLTIHGPTPTLVKPTMQAAQKVMERIPVHRSVWRCSWNFKTSGQKDLSSQYTPKYNEDLKNLAPQLTPENIGDKIFIRIERQTVSRLSKSNCILFGIHLYQNTLDDEQMTSDQARRMLNVLKTTPREMLDYKAITPFEGALLGYLEKRI